MAKFNLDKDSKLKFLGSRQWTNPKNGNILTFVNLGDPHKYLNHEFMVDPNKVNINIPIDTNVKTTFDLDTFNGRASFNLTDLEVVHESVIK